MKYRLDNLHTELSKVSLRSDEKAAIRHSLLSYIEQNPIGAKTVSPFSKIMQGIRSPFAVHYFYRSSYVAAVAIFALVLSGSVSLAAEGALPGDKLYSVKTYVNEGVQGLLAISPEKESALQVSLAGHRLEEAEKLIIQDTANPEVAQKNIETVKRKLDQHLVAFTAEVRKLEDNRNFPAVVEAVTELESSLKAHGNVLSAIEKSEASSSALVLSADTEAEASVQEKVKVALSEVKTSRISAEEEVIAEGSGDLVVEAELALVATEKTITETKEYLESVKKELTPRSYLKVKRLIDDAEDDIKLGKRKAEDYKPAEAFIKYQDARRQAKEAYVSLEQAVDLQISSDAVLLSDTEAAAECVEEGCDVVPVPCDPTATGENETASCETVPPPAASTTEQALDTSTASTAPTVSKPSLKEKIQSTFKIGN